MWDNRIIHDINPRKGITGNLPMLSGTLKGLSASGCLYLNHINERFTKAKMAKAAKFITPATNLISPSRAKIIDGKVTVAIAIHEVPLSLCTVERILGRDPPFAIP